MQLQQLDDRVDTHRDWMKDYKFHLIPSLAKLKQLVDVCIQRKLCSLDLETTGLDNRVYPDEYFADGKKTVWGIRTIDTIAGVCISFDGQNGYYVPFSHYADDANNIPWDEGWAEITRLINACRIIFHGGRFDQEFLYPVTGKDYWKIAEYEDTYLISKVISPLKQSPNGLKPLTKIHFGIDMLELPDLFTPERMEQMKREKQGYNFAALHPKEGLEYGCSDGIFTYKLLPVLREKLSDSDMKIYELEKSFCNVLRELERNRVHIDVDRVHSLIKECTHEKILVGDLIREVIESKTGKTGKWVTLNIGSPPELSEALITSAEGLRLKPTPEMLAEGEEAGGGGGGDDEDEEMSEEDKKYSLKDEALKSLDRVYGAKFSAVREGAKDKEGKPKRESIFELILEWRHYQKMLGSYLTPLSKAVDKNGDVRPNFNQIGTDTTRLSSKAGKIVDGYSGINFQGIPRDSDEDKPELFKQLRTCIIPRPGWMLVKLDYAGEELRVVTNLSGDPIWTRSFLHEDGDVHSITAKTLFGVREVNKDQRNRGKRCNFAFIYGGGAGAIQRNIGCDIQEATRHMENLRNDVPILMGYVEHQKKYARQHKCIFTAFGRRIPIPTIDSQIRGIKAKAERCAINYTIQATSADVLKFAMCWVDKNLRKNGWKDRCRYVLTVHDEVVYEIKPEFLMEIVRKLDEWMTEPWKLQKAHGRTWDVPLLTEPGIDCNWKARYDYFAMVDGIPPVPKDLDAEGKFKGKLKKDQYLHEGRIYQKVPDFLKDWVRPLSKAEAPTTAPDIPEAPKEPDPPPPEPTPVPPEPVREPEPAEEPKPVPDPPKPSEPQPEAKAEPVQSEGEKPVKTFMDMDDLDGMIMLPQSPAPKEEVPAPPARVSADIDPEFGGAEAPSEPKPKPKAEPVKERSEDGLSEKEDVRVVRWTIRASRNRRTMKKLHAVCILAEGNDPLRVVDVQGNIIIPDSAGIRVDGSVFLTLASLFGLS